MDEIKLINVISEIVKQSIDNNPNFSEWEKWWRKEGIEETKKYAKEFYDKKDRLGYYVDI